MPSCAAVLSIIRHLAACCKHRSLPEQQQGQQQQHQDPQRPNPSDGLDGISLEVPYQLWFYCRHVIRAQGTALHDVPHRTKQLVQVCCCDWCVHERCNLGGTAHEAIAALSGSDKARCRLEHAESGKLRPFAWWPDAAIIMNKHHQSLLEPSARCMVYASAMVAAHAA